MRFTHDIQIRSETTDASLDLGYGSPIILKPVQHVLTVEFGDHIAFLYVGARLNGILQNEHELICAATAPTAGAGSRKGAGG
jgi:hypothetical protein